MMGFTSTFGGMIMISRLLAATLLFASAAPQYHFTFLPAGFNAAQLNDAGQVVGDAGGAAAIYAGGVVTTVVAAPSFGAGINDQGDITGYLDRNFTPEAFTYIGGTFTNIDPLVASLPAETSGVEINNSGLVGGNTYLGGENTRGFLFRDGVVEHIGTFGGDYSPLTALNNLGAATGYAAFAGPAGGSYYHAYIYQNGALQDLGTLAGSAPETDSYGSDINDLGQVVGYSGSRPFLYSGGNMIDLGSPGTYAGGAQALNDAGVIVGYALFNPAPSEPDWRAFVYDNGALVDLNTLADAPAGWRIINAPDINEAGQILATACQGSTCSSVLLTPVPEPAAGLLLLAGLGLVAQRRLQGRNLSGTGLATAA
jgi:probable HAF family extracellular repeat protein